MPHHIPLLQNMDMRNMITLRTCLRWIVGLVLFVFMPPVLKAAEEPADALARAVLAKAGIRAGVCEMPRVGDGSLAATLARRCKRPGDTVISARLC